MERKKEYIKKNKYKCKNHICFGCGKCVRICEYCGSPLRTKRISEEHICDDCYDKGE